MRKLVNTPGRFCDMAKIQNGQKKTQRIFEGWWEGYRGIEGLLLSSGGRNGIER